MPTQSQGEHWALGVYRVSKTDHVLALGDDKVYSGRHGNR